MGLVIEILEGIQKGQLFKVTDKATLGRKKADMVIRDPNVSTLHASISINSDGVAFLVDQNSRNGLVINDNVVRKIALYPETKFMVGNTEFIVRHFTDDQLEEYFPTKTWRDLFADEINNTALNTSPPEDILPFNPKVELLFIQGVQSDESKILTFGPRMAGFCSLDIALNEIDSPEMAFKIIPSKDGATIINFDIGKVMLNDSVFESSVLISGDRIKVGESIIKVLFLE